MTASKPLPPLARLREVLNYDPETGALTWRARMRESGPGRQVTIGADATTNGWGGYRTVKIDGRHYQAHRVAFALGHGREPASSLDHKDGNRINNSFANLREATPRENVRNRLGWSPHGKGVQFDKRKKSKPYTARIQLEEGRRLHLGMFATAEEAVAAYARAEAMHFGSFAGAAGRPDRPLGGD